MMYDRENSTCGNAVNEASRRVANSGCLLNSSLKHFELIIDLKSFPSPLTTKFAFKSTKSIVFNDATFHQKNCKNFLAGVLRNLVVDKERQLNTSLILPEQFPAKCILVLFFPDHNAN